MSISVVMATYNGEKYIIEQLDSIAIQLDKDDELLIGDDCSTDDTVSIINQYIEKNEFLFDIKLVVNERNLGFQNNFNNIMKMAKGDYIFFSDQDDLWLEHKIKTMISIMKEYPDCEVLCCDYEPWYMDRGKTAPKYLLKRMTNDKNLERIVLNKQSVYIGQLGCCMCVTRKFRDSLEQYWFNGWAQDDRCWKMGLCDSALYVYHENLIKHRIHDSNTATFGKYHTIDRRVQLFSEMLNATDEMLKRTENCALNNDSCNILRNNKKMMELRIKQLLSRNILFSFRLLRYLSYYQKKKSFFVELYMVIKG